MKGKGSNFLPFAAGVAVSMGVAILAATFHDDTVTSFERWVRDYQTLISGFAAIFAAYVTVTQMQQSDDRQEERHRELVRLGQARDDQAILRFKATVVPLIQRAATSVADFSARCDEGKKEPEWNENAESACQRAFMGLIIVRDAIAGTSTQDCRHLMPADLSYSLLATSVYVDRALELTVGSKTVSSYEYVHFDQLQEWFQKGAIGALASAGTKLQALSRLCTHWTEQQSNGTAKQVIVKPAPLSA